MQIIRKDLLLLEKHADNPLTVPGRISLYLWEHNQDKETLTAFARNFFPEISIHETAVRSDKRFVEQLSIRLMLCQLLGHDAELAYCETGRPLLTNRPWHLSISHTHRIFALSLSDVRHGIDVEQWSDKALRVCSKFLKPAEQPLQTQLSVLGSPAQTATTLWSAKEAAYKFFDCPDTNLHDDIRLVAHGVSVHQKDVSANRDGTFTLQTQLSRTGQEAYIACQQLPQCAVTCCKSLPFSIK